MYKMSTVNMEVKNITEVADNVNQTVYDHYVPKFNFPILILICVILGLMILATIIGNVFVITAIKVDKNLQGVSNYLILSLGVTDLMVAVLVMPLSLVNEVSVYWYLGAKICDMWISIDVLCCTASILHLVVIAIDRYRSVSNIDYTLKKTARGILAMVAIVWLVSVSVSLPPLILMKTETHNPEITGMCIISQNKIYTIFSTIGAFYIPLIIILIINYKIYKVASAIIQKKKSNRNSQRLSTYYVDNRGNCSSNSSRSDLTNEGLTRNGQRSRVNFDDINKKWGDKGDGRNSSIDFSQDSESQDELNNADIPIQRIKVPKINVEYYDNRTRNYSGNDISLDGVKMDDSFPTNNDITKSENSIVAIDVDGKLYEGSQLDIGNTLTVPSSMIVLRNNSKKPRDRGKRRSLLRRENREMTRESKAARVLVIITGAFIVCWLPFFSIALVAPLCEDSCSFPESVFSVFLWLGYFNSLLNPIIYTIFSPNFRNAFKNILINKLCFCPCVKK
ncbi:5-hydroxytryptamine receptor [Patella vulgata]|uniref:5-hydroxytryptamine receptor n=1 Tax=Patella vulgata TaxID=6465 RepID=UPI00217F9CC9|nr:5-hydroxytryptamine receptor [Patella vulgata]